MTDEKGDGKEFPPIDFATFILSLATSAHIQLGLIPNPISKETEKDFGGAKQTVDILEVLEEKTKGNLDQNEGELLKNILYDLRMRYIDATSGGKK